MERANKVTYTHLLINYVAYRYELLINKSVAVFQVASNDYYYQVAKQYYFSTLSSHDNDGGRRRREGGKVPGSRRAIRKNYNLTKFHIKYIRYTHHHMI